MAVVNNAGYNMFIRSVININVMCLVDSVCGYSEP